MKEQGSISIHTENIFPVIKKFLYSDNEIFLRELVSNAVDATQKLKRLASLGEFKGELGKNQVEVSFDESAKTITIHDNGIGMTAEEVKKYINQIAFSGATEFVEKYQEAKDANEIIGKFGLGFYSAFMVADLVEIQSLSYKEGAEPVKWTCDGSTSYQIEEGNRQERGTDIILHVNEESAEFLNQFRLREILDKYAKFLPVSVKFGTKKEGEEEVDLIINNPNPAWVKSPADLQDQDYIDFYRELYPLSMEDPLFWIHMNVDYPFNLTGILYFPKVKEDFDFQKNKIKLYSRQVFITEEVKDVVPDFLMLLHGVIDSPDIPLNVSRSFLQADGNVRKINSHITKKVADKLAEIFKTDRKGFEEKWPDIEVFVKYGILSDEKFAEKAKEFCLLKDSEGKYYTFNEYAELVKDTQKDKENKIVYLYSNDIERQDSFVQSAILKGYNVLILNTPLDSHFVSYLERTLENTTLKRVDSDVVDKLIEKETTITLAISEEEKQAVQEVFTNNLDKATMTVSVEAMDAKELPVVITMDEFSRRMKEMAQTGGGSGMAFYGSIPDQYKVAVNGNHVLVQKILAAEDAEIKGEIAKQALDLALLSKGLLIGSDLTKFIHRSIGFIEDK